MLECYDIVLCRPRTLLGAGSRCDTEILFEVSFMAPSTAETSVGLHENGIARPFCSAEYMHLEHVRQYDHCNAPDEVEESASCVIESS